MNPLTDAQHRLLDESRRAVLATMAADGRAQLVPIAFAIAVDDEGGVTLYSALDEKPKKIDDPHSLARVRNILARPRVSVLVDHWSEDWSDLRWLRLEGTAVLLEPARAEGDPGADGAPAPAEHERAAAEHGRAVTLLRARYPQYSTHRLEARPILRISVERAVSWASEA